MSIGTAYIRNTLSASTIQPLSTNLKRSGIEMDVEGQAGAYALVYFNDNDTPDEVNGSHRIYTGETWSLMGLDAADFGSSEFLFTRPLRVTRGHKGPDADGPEPVFSILEFQDTTP